MNAASNTNKQADLEYHLLSTPLDQVITIYADLVGRTILRSSSGPAMVPKDALITLDTQSRLTRTEAIEALETVLGMNGITIVPIETNSTKSSPKP